MELIFSVESLADLFNKTPGEITDALKESDQPAKDAWLKLMVSELSQSDISAAVIKAKQIARDEGYGQAKREVLTNLEKTLRTTHDVEGSTVEDIVQAVIDKNKTTTPAQSNISNVKDSEEYKTLEMNSKKIIAQLRTDLETEKSNRQKDIVLSEVGSSLENTLRELKFVLPDKESQKSAWLKVIKDNLENEDTKLSVMNGQIVVLDKDGKLKVDQTTMKDISFVDLVSSVAANYLDTDSSDGKNGTGNKKPLSQVSNKFDFSNIKSTGQYIAAMGTMDLNNPEDIEKSKALEAYYSKQVSEGAIAG